MRSMPLLASRRQLLLQFWLLLTLYQAIVLFATGVQILAAPTPTALPRVELDLNRARLPELMLLPGVGRARAEAIILQRVRRGPFRRVEDLLVIPGIGVKTLAGLAPYLRIGGDDDG